MKKTLHLKKRCQQRGIKEELIPLVKDFGATAKSYDGATHIILNKKHCQLIESMLNDLIEEIQKVGVVNLGSLKFN